MLPQHKSGGWGGDLKSTRFGNFAMEKLINELVKAGCARERMEIKVFGGGNVTDTSNAIGTDNSEFVCAIWRPKACARRQDLGGILPRRIHYYPDDRTGDAQAARHRRSVRRRSRRADYGNRLLQAQPAGEIQLFGED